VCELCTLTIGTEAARVEAAVRDLTLGTDGLAQRLRVRDVLLALRRLVVVFVEPAAPLPASGARRRGADLEIRASSRGGDGCARDGRGRGEEGEDGGELHLGKGYRLEKSQ